MTLPPTAWWPCDRCCESPWPNQSALTDSGYLCPACRGETVTAARPLPRRDPKVMRITTHIPLRIRTARVDANLTVAQLAKRVGVSCGSVDRWEDGTRRPDPSLLCAIAGAIGCTVGFFFGETSNAA